MIITKVLYYPQLVYSRDRDRYVIWSYTTSGYITSPGALFSADSIWSGQRNQTESIVINLEVFDGHVETLSDKTLVTVSHPSSTVILPFDLNGSPDSETGSEFGNALQ